MTKTRNDIRLLVRAQMDMDADELPSTLLDPWIEDGFARTLAVEERWPFFETQWDFTTVLNQTEYPKTGLPGPNVLDKVSSVTDRTTSYNVLQSIPQDRAESEFYGSSSSVPAYWSDWGGNICVWPAPTAGRTVRVRGYRKPSWASGDAVVVDADERLHMALYFFVCSMAYAQQEDDALAGFYMAQWQQAVGQAHDSIMAAPQRRPIILSGNVRGPWVGGFAP